MAAHVEEVLAALEKAGTPLSPDDLARYRVRYASGAALILAMVQHGILQQGEATAARCSVSPAASPAPTLPPKRSR